MATTITFNDGSTSITIPTSDYPGQTQSFLDQSIQTAMGGRITSITRSAGEKKRWILNWRSLSHTTVSGATTQFTYTDETSTNYTVKYTGGIENAQLVDFDSYAVEVNLAEIT
jgi:hypothetical protein